MGQITLPFVFHNQDDADADQVIANFNAVITAANGGLEAGVNIRTAAPTVQPGSTQQEGSAPTLLRSDSTFIIRGVETLTTDPTTGLFEGRLYYNTSTNQLRQCTDPSGSGTWITIGNLAASDLPAHATRHASGGPDPLPANSIDQTMFASRTVLSASPGSDVTLTASSSTDVITGLSVTTTGTSGQAVRFDMNVAWVTGANAGTLAWFLVDDTGTIRWNSGITDVAVSNNQARYYSKTLTVVGTKVFKLRAVANVSGMTVKKLDSNNRSITTLDAVVG